MRCIEPRLTIAILVSVLAHLAILAYLQPVWEPAKRGDRQGLLKVTLTRLAQTTHPVSDRADAAALSLRMATELHPPELRAGQPSATTAVLAADPGTGESSQKELGAKVIPGAPRGPSRLSALLVIDPSGRVGTIVWNQLPPMTDAALQRLEQSLRQNPYPATGMEYRVIEALEPWLEKEPGP